MKHLMHSTTYKFRVLFGAFLLYASFFRIDSFAQPGSLDPSFGEQGKALGVGFGYGKDMALLKSGKILMVGHSGNILSLGRFLNDGKPDSSFGIFGESQINMNLNSQEVNIALLANGKFIIAGTSIEFTGSNLQGDAVLNYDFLVMRFKENGTLDSSFGTNGIVKTDVGNTDLEYCVALQADDKILVGGSTNRGALMVRYLQDGTADESFGDAGVRVITSYPIIRSVAIQQDGKILAGSTNEDNFFNQKFRLVRYESNGALDTTFGERGIRITDFGKGSDQLVKLLIQKNGQILVAGNTNATSISSEMLICRYSQNGMLDSSFGTDAKGVVKFESEIAVVLDFDVQQNGSIILCGSSYVLDGDEKFALARFDENGNNDSTFGTDGKVITDFGNSGPANSLEIQDDGKILAGGHSYHSGSTTDFAIARYYGDPTHPLIAKIKRWIRNHILNFQSTQDGSMAYYAIEKQTGTGGFKQVASIPANAANNYSYNLSTAGTTATDNNYRIKGVAKNGGVVYSDVITDAATAAVSFKVYPNPAQQSINISADKPLTLRLQNSNGVVLLTQKVTGNDKMDISKLRAGIYYLVDAESGVSVRVVKE